MPDRTGNCSWCGVLIVDEHTLSARKMLAQISGREPTAVLRAVAEPGGGTTFEAPSRPGKPRGPLGRPVVWTPEKVIQAIQAFARAHGRTPTVKDGKGCLPGWNVYGPMFGGWAGAVEAAGLTQVRRGRPPKSSGGVDVDDSPALPPEELLDALAVS